MRNTGPTNKKKQSAKDTKLGGFKGKFKPKSTLPTRTPGKLKGSKVMYGYKKGGQV